LTCVTCCKLHNSVEVELGLGLGRISISVVVAVVEDDTRGSGSNGDITPVDCMHQKNKLKEMEMRDVGNASSIVKAHAVLTI